MKSLMSGDDRILFTEKLNKVFGGIRALDGLDITIRKNQIHGLIGPNGAGKSTFFNVITGLLPPSGGKVFLDSDSDLVDVTDLPAEIITKMGIGRTFQRGKLVPEMTVLENVMCGVTSHNRSDNLLRHLFQVVAPFSHETRIKQQALEVLDSVGMIDSADRWASELVWVERQLVQMARSLAANPKLILLDEPTSGMGVEESNKVKEIIRQIHAQGVTVAVVSHDVNLIISLCDWITALNFGIKISEGTPEQIQNDPLVLEAYLGH